MKELISNLIKVFLKILAQKYPNKAFLVPNLGICPFRKILQLDKFEAADFKYDNSIFKILAQKYLSKAFLVKNIQRKHFLPKIFAFLFFHKILQLDRFKGADFKYDNSFSNIIAHKYPNKAFWVKNTQISHFWSQI